MKGFISYAHTDHGNFERMRVYLKPVERAYGVDFWADRRIEAGDYWNGDIARAIQSASAYVLLMSPGYFASDYIFDHELPAIAKRRKAGALVVPVLVDRVMWEWAVGVLQATPMNDKGQLEAIADWKPSKRGFEAASRAIANAISTQFAIKPASPIDWGGP